MILFLVCGICYFGFYPYNVVQGKTICEPGQFSVNGVCLQKFNFCPANSILLNGVCFPASSGNCPKGQIWINNECCTEECIVSCEKTSHCPCCGKMNITEAQSCNISFIPPCHTPTLPCQLDGPKPTSEPEDIECQAGTVLVKGYCLLVHCLNGIFKDGRCMSFHCPPGTFWLKDKCIMEKVHNYHIAYNHSYNIQVNSSNPTVVIKNINNVYINSLPDDLPNNKQTVQNMDHSFKGEEGELANLEEFYETTSIQKTTDVPTTWEEILKDEEDSAKATPCCNVVSPRICKEHNATKSWTCFNRKHEHCGDICQAKTICLLPAKSRPCRDYIIVVPPPKTFTEIPRGNANIDCSGCVHGDYNKCHNYCYHYAPCSDLSPLDTQPVNEEEFCANNTGVEGCLKADASYDSLPNFA